MISSVVKELEVQLSEKNQKVEEVYGNISEVFLDRNIMKIVLHNLITNAIRYSPHESTILITVDKDINDYTLVTVRDKGIGIPEQEKSNIFKKMYRAENSKQHVPGGSGLGLYLIKSIIEESNGKIWFESKENEGTIFFLLLPPEGMRKREGSRELTI